MSVTPTPARIGPSSSTEINIKVQDPNFDYNTLQASFVLSTGSIGIVNRSWSQNLIYQFDVMYYSPSISTLYQINITITDGASGSANFMLVVSNRQSNLSIHSIGDLYLPVGASVSVYRTVTGQYITGGSTNGNGYITFSLYDDLYYVTVFSGFDTFLLNNIWINNAAINKTVIWTQLTVYSTGVGGAPLSGTFVEVYPENSTTRLTYGWTNTQGFTTFIIRPGVYKIVLTATNSITFDNIVLKAGESLNLGSNIPKVSSPNDVFYYTGSTGNTVSWVLQDSNPAYYNVTLNGVVKVPKTTWTNGTVVTVNVDGLSAGTYFLIITVNNTLGYSQSDLVIITVAELNNVPPIISIAPTSETLAYGSTGNSLSWTASDTNPNTYTIYRNGTSVSTGFWLNNTAVSISTNGLTVGYFNFTIVFYDTNNAQVSNTVFVRVINYAPQITHPLDMSFSAGSSGNSVSWIGYDYNPNNYKIYNNNTVVQQGPWTNGTAIQVALNSLSMGFYNITIIIYDSLGLFAKDTVMVTVTNPAPTISQPSDITFNAGTTGHKITWSASDNNPANYTILRNGIKVAGGVWTSPTTITIGLDDLIAGTYNFTLTLFDTKGLSTSDSVKVTVNNPTTTVPTPKVTISSPPDLKYYQSWNNITITWSVVYKSAYGQSWNLIVDNAIVNTGILLNNTNYSFNISALNLVPGLHNITFQAIVQDFNKNQFSYSDSVNVTVIYQKIIQSGSNTVSLGGQSDADINIDVGHTVTLTVVTSTDPSSNASGNALKNLNTTTGLTSVSYFLDITISNKSALNGLWINISYANWNLTKLNIDESSLKIYFYNITANQWQPSGITGVDIVNKIIYAHIFHLSEFSAVAAPHVPNGTTTTQGGSPGGSPGSSTSSKVKGAPGFEWFFIIVLVVIPIVRKRKSN